MKAMKYLFSFLLVFTLSQTLQAQIVSDAEHKIIFQLTYGDAGVHQKFIRQLNNILQAAPNAKIEVVTHGMGIDLLKLEQNTFEDELLELSKKGIHFVICENTLKQRGMHKNQFLPLAGFVPSAILELVQKQENGWIYIKAGG
jgi:intracellular sulfur oxidation DsrE/DsrF family protein